MALKRRRRRRSTIREKRKKKNRENIKIVRGMRGSRFDGVLRSIH